MNIVHHMTFNSAKGDSRIQILDELEISYKFTAILEPNGIVTIDISEKHPAWPKVKELCLEWQCPDIVHTEFSKAELYNADFLMMQATWINGYPMPDEDNGFISVTYGGSGCAKCGGHRVQSGAFQLRSEPKWGSRSIMTLNWIPDEFFVTPKAFQEVFAKFGIAAHDVLRYGSRSTLNTVLQLEIDEVSESALQLGTPANLCSNCGLERFLYQSAGFFPALVKGDKRLPIFRTRESFGEGGITWSEIIVTQDVYRAITTHKLRGVSFHPLQNPP